MQKRDYHGMMRGIAADSIERAVDAYVHSDRDKQIIKLSLLHDISYTRIADIIDPWVSSRTVQNVLNKWMPIIMEHLQR